MPRPTERDVDRYARDVVDERELAGKYHRLACARHLHDRAREGTAAFPYVFDWSAAERFFRFMRCLRHKAGEWDGRPIEPMPHQVFRLGSVFGWRHATTGRRRFHTAYNELTRKSGKSLEAAVVAAYCTFFDGEPGAEGYVTATTKQQASIVFTTAKDLARNAGLVKTAKAKRRRLTASKNNLSDLITLSKLEPLAGDASLLDGLNPYVVVMDEFHAYKSRGIVDVIETATGARRNWLLYQITCAGTDPLSPCGVQHRYATQVLDGIITDESFFAFIAHADEGDDWQDERTWRKANPSYGTLIKPEYLEALARHAQAEPSNAPAFKQKNLNIWQDTLTPWLSIEDWRAGQTPFDPTTLEGRVCFGGLDLSSKIDLTAFALAFPPLEDGDDPRWHYLYWILSPADTLAARAHRDRAPYLEWRDSGHLLAVPGKRIEHTALREIVNRAGDLYDIHEIGFDTWNIGDLDQQLEGDGFAMTEVPMTTQSLTHASKDFEAEVLDRLVNTGAHPIAQWAAANVVVLRDGKDNIFPTKRKSHGRIDPIVASIMARKMAGVTPLAEKQSAYADHGLEVV